MAVSSKTHAKGAPFPPLKSGILRLYSMRFCPFAERTRLVLAHKDIPYETVNVSLNPKTDKPDWFLERNPLGLVPVLEKDDKIIYESAVCNEYLDTLCPEKRLTPSDPYRLAQDQMLLARLSKVTSNTPKIRQSQGKDEEAIKEAKLGLEVYEKALAERGTFFGGDQVCMLDFYLWPFFERMPVMKLVFNLDLVNTEEFPNLASWMENMIQVPAVAKCRFTPEQHVAFMKSQMTGKPDYDLFLEE